jgi:hypothetical protein
MCTVTLLRDQKRLLLTFNRDEKRTRRPEVPPALSRDHEAAVSMLAPRDSEAGGLWIGVNSAGVVAALLNGYEPGDDPSARDRVSRGAIIPKVLAAGDYFAAMKLLQNSFRPECFLSFTLLVATPLEGVQLQWNGRELTSKLLNGPSIMISSSSWRREEVLHWRHGLFAEWIRLGSAFVDELPSFHLMQIRGSEEWSPLMERQESATRSITQVEISAGSALMRYWPAPIRAGMIPSSATRLALAR